MVKFGERLRGMKISGWEAFYIDYEGLKTTVDRLENSQSTEAASSAFLAALAREVAKVDAHVTNYSATLRAEFEAARGKGKGAMLRELNAVEGRMSALRRFVGTNVIAATKIVKKHDKHVSPALQKRSSVGDLIRQSSGLNELPNLHAAITSAVKDAGGSTCAVTVEHLATGLTKGDDGDDEEAEGDLRALPNWLLRGAYTDEQEEKNSSALPEKKSFRKSKEDFFDTFYTTFLSDWRFDEDEHQLLHNKIGWVVGSDADDNWNVAFEDDAVPWSQLSTRGKLQAVVVNTLKVGVILFALYAFICSLSFLADGFRLVAGKQAGDIFAESELFNNPLAGMLVGVLVTVLVQSSSTSTSIVITMVAADLFTVKQAISLVMGANIGTSVTSTIVALAQSGQRDEFRRAFAAATVHDMFNFLTVAILLPIEAATGYLFKLSEGLIKLSPGLSSASKPPDILKAITKPFTKSIISLDKKLIADIAKAKTADEREALSARHMLKKLFDCYPPKNGPPIAPYSLSKENNVQDCGISDGAAGGIVLIAALLILCFTLFAIVYTLKSMLKGRVAIWLHKSVNGQVPDIKLGNRKMYMGWLSGYLAMGTGLLVTICVQSSSITTSALTPLVGLGVISVERMYPTVLGANIGTCITGILAALAASASKLEVTLQVAYAHLLFNISGILIWYVFWPARAVPIRAAKFLGDTTANYKWFAIAYLIVAFFLVPGIFMGLSLAADAAAIAVAAIAVALALCVTAINMLQTRRPDRLPPVLRNWDFMPVYLRSLEPMDRIVCTPFSAAFLRVCPCCLRCGGPKKGRKTATQKDPAGSVADLEVAAARL